MNNESTLYILITKWAHDRNIINGCGVKDQFPKLISEFGELVAAIEDLESPMHDRPIDISEYYDTINRIQERIVDGIGDTLVVLTVLAGQLDYDMDELVAHASGSDLGTSRDSRVRLLTSSFGLLGDSIAKGQRDDALAFIGIATNLLSALAVDCKTTVLDCLAYAYNEIKDRKGIMYNGTFIKESDSAYAYAVEQVQFGDK